MERLVAAYDLDDVKSKVRMGSFRTTGRVGDYIAGKDLRISSHVQDVFDSVEPGDFISSTMLTNQYLPHVFADEYIIPLENGDWYLKFYVDGDEIVIILSLCEDLGMH